MDQPVILNKSLSMLKGQPLRVWLPQVALLGYLIVALTVFLVVPAAATRWLGAPNLGVLFGPGLYVLETQPDSPAYAQGLRSGDQVVQFGETPVSSAVSLDAALKNHAIGETVMLQVLRAGGKPFSISMPLVSMPNGNRVAYLFIPFTVGVIFLASAVWSFTVRRTRTSGQIVSFFFTSVAIVLASVFDLFTSQQLVGLWLIALGLTAGAGFNLAFVFPREAPILRRLPVLRLGLLVPGILLALYAIYTIRVTVQFQLALQLLTGLVCLATLFTVGYAGYRHTKIALPNEREQLRYIIFAGIFSFGPFLVWMALHFLPMQANYPPAWVILPLIIFPIVTGYTLQRYRLHQADFILGRTMLYGVMAVLVAVGYALLTVGLSLIFGRLFSLDNPLFSGLIFFILAVAILPMRERMQKMIDALFFRGAEAFQDRLSSFSSELTRVVDLNSILNTLRRYISEVLAPSQMHIFILDPLSDQYVATPGKNNRPTSDLRFTSVSPLVQLLTVQRGPILLADQNTLPVAFQAEKARLDLLGASVFVALPGQERLAGWVGLGKRNSGELFSARELNLLEALCDQAAIAIERAQVLANMENRVRQMDVLARVAQGVNITLNMDDILELIYAQTTQIIHADEFHIMLYDAPQDTFQYVFYLEEDERFPELENKPVPAGDSLEQEVIQQHKSIFTEDYGRECQRRRVVTTRDNLFAWLAVPLNAGAETFGVLSLGSRDPRMEYTTEQLNLAQSIADQVAGAIIKARLLQETERRALQLTTLNDMTRQLTSTLDLEPLLQNILQSAVDILVCEAGSLLLVDETTEESVFRVVVGSVASNLVNRRLPPGTGVVGKAVKNRQPIIVNDVTRFPEWFSKTDQQTGFITRALLVIPLQVKDKVIGVIEVINKKDGTPYTQDDQDLLSAFAAQAAVAIENARLYTMTDQALAARVEELSVMQRIDRELNTSLDTSRAMRITLEWAMRQSGAQAGLVGVLQETGLKMMASQGYTHELEPFPEDLLPIDTFDLEAAVAEAIPMRRRLNGEDDNRRLLSGARTQVVIPIRREANTIGVLFLESIQEEVGSEENMNFLVRLSDHASIAIFNAQLYTAVQNANLAKSEFVSFVAHELKNPMTSVKGYTELLAAGAVGAVSDAQANFLNTIRSNIERMNTLVSDLNDVSKIEVGRLRLDFKAIALPEIIEGVIRSTRRQIEEKQQVLAFEIAPELPQAWADRTRVEQVLVNLVSNAHKYTLAGGTITVGASRDANTWDSGGAPEVIHIWVKDSGIGINEEDQKKIFQKFFRSDDPKTREVPGTGLGLNITKSLVEMQGGKIWFESEFRQGTTFHFTVPISAQ
jgi:signal transduction histidine kinase